MDYRSKDRLCILPKQCETKEHQIYNNNDTVVYIINK